MLPRLLSTTLRNSRTVLSHVSPVRVLLGAARVVRKNVKQTRSGLVLAHHSQQRALHLVHEAAKSYAFSLPTHSCGTLNAQHAGSRVVLGGWIEAKRILTNVNKKHRDGEHSHVLVFVGTQFVHDIYILYIYHCS